MAALQDPTCASALSAALQPLMAQVHPCSSSHLSGPTGNVAGCQAAMAVQYSEHTTGAESKSFFHGAATKKHFRMTRAGLAFY